ncbi:hypothetical protein Pcinc_002148 [Petrolisthes cinctipes]|uniref:Uncharacterized protein n=1 Tax=Petrolisthes cinctipes TaxID=88211 RepID=A0AAE1GLG9_PETCI|nr:hypothetical protein Pcinc_002148 [Petrolisthes cinctipes]
MCLSEEELEQIKDIITALGLMKRSHENSLQKNLCPYQKSNDNARVIKEKIIRELQKMRPVPGHADLENDPPGSPESPAVPPEEKGGIWTMFDQARKKN